MDTETMKRLVEQARQDPGFFHALVFDPEKAMSRLDYLSRDAKSALLQIKPENVIGGIIGVPALRKCTETCGNDSCAITCGPGSCNFTCGSSCGGNTCGVGSCGFTTFLTEVKTEAPV